MTDNKFNSGFIIGDNDHDIICKDNSSMYDVKMIELELASNIDYERLKDIYNTRQNYGK